MPSPRSAGSARESSASSGKDRGAHDEALFLSYYSQLQPIIREPRRRSKPNAEGGSDGIVAMPRRKRNLGTRECKRLSRSDESSREVVDETA